MPKTKEELIQVLREQQNPTITDEDKNTYPEANMRNKLIDYLGLPQQYKMTQADKKQYDANLPMNMGLGTMGTVGSRAIAPAIPNIAAAEAVHGLEKVAAQNAMQKAGQLAEKGSQRFKELFKQFKNENMKMGGS